MSDSTASSAQANRLSLAVKVARPEALDRWLLIGLTSVCVFPIWTVPYFPSMDGPVHLWIAHIMSSYERSPILKTYLTFSEHLDPNLAVYGVLFVLGRFFDLLIAEKIFLTLWCVLFCFGAMYAVRSVNRDASAVALLFVPLAFTSFVHYGFYNFCISMALFLVGFGYWFRREGNLGLKHTLLMLAFNLALVMTHLVGFVVMALTVGVTFVMRMVGDLPHLRRTGAGWPALKRWVREGASLLLAFLPAVVVVVAFLGRDDGSIAGSAAESLWRPVARIVMMRHLYSFGELEMLLFVPLVLLVACLFARMLYRKVRTRDWARADALLAVLLALIGLSVLNPVSSRDVLLSSRLEPFVLFVALLWLASAAPTQAAGGRALIVGVCASVVAVTSGYRAVHYARLNDVLAEYASIGGHVTPSSTLLALDLWKTPAPLAGERLTWRGDPFRHVGAHIARERGGVYLRGSLLSPTAFGYFPILYRDSYDPYRHIGPEIDEAQPPDGDILGYRQRTGGAIDYVVLWGAERDDAPVVGPGGVTKALRQIGAAYDLVYVSAPRRLARLYRWRGDELPAGAGNPPTRE
jgi:hypothetical protein